MFDLVLNASLEYEISILTEVLRYLTNPNAHSPRYLVVGGPIREKGFQQRARLLISPNNCENLLNNDIVHCHLLPFSHYKGLTILFHFLFKDTLSSYLQIYV